MTKSKILVKSKNHDFPKFSTEEAGTGFLTPKARLVFTQLRQAFVETSIFHHFDPKSYIRIETDVSGYAMSGILSQLSSGTWPDGVVTKDDLRQWHLIAFFFRKMIPAETWYKTHNGKLLAIVKTFKTWQHNVKGCKHKVLVLTDHNNFCHFMNTKSLSADKSVGPKSSFAITFALIINRVKPMELQMLYRNTFSKMSRKNYPLSQKHHDFAPAAVLYGQRFYPFLRRHFPSSTDFCLRHCCFSLVAAVLELFSKQDSPQRPLQYQYWSYEAQISRPANGQQSAEETLGCRASWRMERHWRSALVWRPSLHSWDHLIGVNQLIS